MALFTGKTVEQVYPSGKTFTVTERVYVLADGVTRQDGSKDGFLLAHKGSVIDYGLAVSLGLVPTKETTVAPKTETRPAKA